MKFTLALTALAAVAYAAPQATSASGGGVTAVISPTGSAPAGAQTSYAGAFEITVVNITSPTKRDVQKVCEFIMFHMGETGLISF
jgi:hypothetical protein